MDETTFIWIFHALKMKQNGWVFASHKGRGTLQSSSFEFFTLSTSTPLQLLLAAHRDFTRCTHAVDVARVVHV